MVKDIPAEELWNDTLPARPDGRGIYIAISGNTSGGKSSLIRAIVARSQKIDVPVVAINERLLHHPLLRMMFSNPVKYAFPIQLNFMLQRHLALQRHLELGKLIVIERSHFDDELFVREHADAGNIAADQYDAYRHLASVLHARVPAPDVLILLNPPPEVSIARLRRAEELGERPREFPDEESKERWILRWYTLYQDLHEQFRQRCKSDPVFRNTTLLEPDPHAPTETLADEVMALLEQRAPEMIPASVLPQ
jgi:deoxyadenosine/deoxycytidine kinase